jgi:myo-inositol-1(or 4)-monophosphatase
VSRRHLEDEMASPSAEVADLAAHAGEVVGRALDALRAPLLRATGRVDVTAKSDGTPVTSADLEADERLTEAILGAFPDHGILSEEQRTTAPEDTEWCWVIDPIDGTSNFISGLPYWCVSVALTYLGQPVLAMVDGPPLDARYSAVRGGGTTYNGRPVRVRAPVAPDDATRRHVPLMLTTSTARRARRAGIRLNPRVMGATALDLCLVAEGVAAGSLALIPHVWDVAAGTLLVEEAGGAIVTLDGEALLPLRAGQDYGDRAAVTASGPSAAWVRDVAGRLLPR